ncbi:hypothetical protein LP419_27275 [Massilia sp. H-1]|nr:hypothetical protein LP419_27275 [Massilia sp. H-1]
MVSAAADIAAPAAPVPPPPAAPAPVQQAKGAPRPMSQPPKREPIRLRWWLVALASLWAIWLYARPSPNKIEARIERATLASAECRLNDAQSELIALRMTRATPQQLASLQATINAASVSCARKKQRVKAWEETTVAVENALSSNDFACTNAPVAIYPALERGRRHSAPEGQDRQTARGRAAAGRSSAAMRARSSRRSRHRRRSRRSRCVTSSTRPSALAAGNYRAASDKLEVCVTMVDPGNRECAAFKVHADRMQREQRRCFLDGRQWAGDRCR